MDQCYRRIVFVLYYYMLLYSFARIWRGEIPTVRVVDFDPNKTQNILRCKSPYFIADKVIVREKEGGGHAGAEGQARLH
jgi:hypothetical protein